MWIQSGLASTPPVTFSHSTTTVPLKSRRLIGRSTTMRVLYVACDDGATDHLPSPVSGAVGVYAVAVPPTKNSCCVYPTLASGKVVCAKTMGTPLPPVTGPLTVGELESACATAVQPATSRSAHTRLHTTRRTTTIPPERCRGARRPVMLRQVMAGLALHANDDTVRR